MREKTRAIDQSQSIGSAANLHFYFTFYLFLSDDAGYTTTSIPFILLEQLRSIISLRLNNYQRDINVMQRVWRIIDVDCIRLYIDWNNNIQ